MIIVDTALQKREDSGQPVQVAIIGTGYMGKGIARQLLHGMPGLRLAGVCNRTLENGKSTYTDAGAVSPKLCTSVREVETAISDGMPLIVEDSSLLCEAGNVDVILESTGEVDFGADIAIRAIKNGKHVVLMNAELDATVGPILKVLADKAGVIVTNCDGDEPGVAMNLVRFAKTIGYKPVAAGNIKGMIDRYRTPATQQAFAEKYKQNTLLITSAADGTKLSMEATVLANATGFGVGQRGMFGIKTEHVMDTLNFFGPEHFEDGGLVDYTVGAAPHTGAWVIGYNEDALNREYMNYFKMGDGPYYCFYTPYHLPHLQVLTTVARAALFQDATTAPVGAPCTEVLTVAKRDLVAGEVLDGIGGFDTYGDIDNAPIAARDGCLPMGLSQGCTLARKVQKDQVITYADVTRRQARASDKLRSQQDAFFADELKISRL